MFKINTNNYLNSIILRGNNLTRLNNNKKNSKKTLIILRSPKHFNIGKHKIFSFNNHKSYKIQINAPINNYFLNNNYTTFFNTQNNYNINYNFKINSVRLNYTTKIKWCDK